MKNKISVIIPFYAKGSFKELERCIESICIQEIKPNDIHIAINGLDFYKKSYKDKINLLIKKVKEENIKIYVYYLSIASVTIARNYAINKSKNEWICTIDADDYMESSRIKSFCEHIELLGKDQEPWVVYTPAIPFIKNKFGNIWRTAPVKLLDLQLSFKNPILHPTTFFQRDIFIKVGKYRNYKIIQDYDLFLRIRKYSKQIRYTKAFYRINKPLTFYNVELSNMKLSLSYEGFNEKIKYQLKNFNLLPYKIFYFINPFIYVFSIIRHTFRIFKKRIFLRHYKKELEKLIKLIRKTF